MKLYRIAALLAPLLGAACLQPSTTSEPAQSSGAVPVCTLALSGVNVIPMDRERVLLNHTIQIAGDRILAVVPDSDVAADCEIEIAGAGRYVMPGLNDLHGHIETTAFAEALGVDYGAVNFPDVFAPYPRYGVTGIRILSGAPDILAFRDSDASEFGAPMIVTSGRMLSGAPPVIGEPLTQIVETEDQARVAVREQAFAGYDLVKVRSNLQPQIFAAIVDEATRLDLPVDGHLQRELSLEDVLSSGQSGIAHVFDLTFALRNGAIEEDALIAALQACRCYVSTTLVVLENIADQIEDHAALLARPEMAHMHPMVAANFWAVDMNPTLSNPNMPPAEFFREILTEAQAMVVSFEAAGIPLLLGSDALNPMLVHGTAVHDELDLLVEGGLTPYQALRTGTVNPAASVPGFEDVGRIAAGSRANLVMINANPLEDHTVLRHPEAVVLNGLLLDATELQARVDAAIAHYPEP
jgi:imidazolonepropionase-like amidohydrolase